MKALLFACVAFLFLCASWCCIALRTDPVVGTEGARSHVALDSGFSLEVPEVDSTRAAAGPSGSASAVEVTLTDLDLIERLRGTARAYLGHEERELEMNLESLLFVAATPRRVLRLVEDGRLARGTLEEHGAVLVIGFGAGSEARRSALTLDGRPFTREFLEALSRLDAERAAPLSEFAASLVVAGRPAVGPNWLPLITVLREQWPDHASNFDPLVRAILAGGAAVTSASDVQAELAAILSNSTDPLTIEAALAVLLATDPDGALLMAEDLHSRSKRAPAIAEAVVNAIARHAPVDAAAASLARLANGSQYGAFLRFGERPGALSAVEREYSALVAERASPIGRKLLVSAMGAEEPAVLLGIADTDPDAGVRHQAFLTLTLKPTATPEVMQTLRARHAARADPSAGMSTAAALRVAENLTLNGSPSVRDEAVRWFKEVVLDPSERLEDRQVAWKKLTARARAEEIAGLEAPR